VENASKSEISFPFAMCWAFALSFEVNLVSYRLQYSLLLRNTVYGLMRLSALNFIFNARKS
jgi:hypothetical protein